MRKKIDRLFVNSNTTIKETMQIITKAAHVKLPTGIALVVDDNKLTGTVTDGDIRKALVKGIGLDEKVEGIMAKDPITVEEGLTIDAMIKMMEKKVKEAGRISDYKVDKLIITAKDGAIVDVVDFYQLHYNQGVKYKNICIIGVGHIGLTLSVLLSEAGCQVVGFDVNERVIKGLNDAKIDFYEKGVEPLLKFHLKERNLTFNNNLKALNTDTYIICVGTAVDEKTKKPTLGSLRKAAAKVGKVLKKGDIVILRSTVPVGVTREILMPILERASSLAAGRDFYLAFAPERALEGQALQESKEIPQIIGGINKKSAQIASRIFQSINSSIIILENCEEAEMAKLINNTFRDFSFAFANKIALICEKLNLDSVRIIRVANEGYPRNPVSLPSPGVGGDCLTKDPYLMADLARKTRSSPDIFLETRRINDSMPHFVADKILQFIKTNWSNEKKVKIYLIGFAFKGYPETSDMRKSPTINVLEILQNKLGKKADFSGYDPIVKKDDIEEKNVKYLHYQEGFKDAHCVLLMNNNYEFAKIDIFGLLETMKKPGFLFDGWNFFNPKEISRVRGIIYQGLGGGL